VAAAWGRIKGTAQALLIIFWMCLLSAYNSFDFRSPPIWDGQAYHELIERCEAKGCALPVYTGARSHYDASYDQRVLYVLLMCHVSRLVRPLHVNPYFLINLLAMCVTGVYLYRLCRTHCGSSRLTGVFAAVSFTLFPAVAIINQVQAHPDLLACAFLAAALYHFRREQWLITGAVLLAGVLVKQSVGFLIVYFLSELTGRALNSRAALRTSIPVGSFLVACLGVGIWLIELATPPMWFDPAILNLVWEHNYSKLFPALLYNFGLLTLPVLTGLYAWRRRDGVSLLLYGTIGMIAVLAVATDFHRVFFGLLFPFALPAAWCHLERLYARHVPGTAYFLLGAFLLLFLMPLTSTHDNELLFHVDYVRHSIVAGILLAGEWLRCRRASCHGPSPNVVGISSLQR
jgi:hypothetical protein